MKTIYAFLCALLMTAFVLAGCEPKSQTTTIIDWADFINLNGASYQLVYDAAIRDPSFVQEQVGEVKFKVADNVTDPQYKIKNGDAAFWQPGTKIYAIKNYPKHEYVAIPSDKAVNGYKIYASDASTAPKRLTFASLPRNQVTKVQIYSENEQKELHGKQVQDLFVILDQGKPTSDNIKYDGAKQYKLVFQTEDPLAYTLPVVAIIDHQFYFVADVSYNLPDTIGQWL
ncbi:MAG: hypothetical protein ACXVOI_08355 [Tumebacillaceae bacterium]